MNLRTTLYKHQCFAVNKLLPARVGGLFMDMGTGKTRTAIELIYRRQERISRVIWFCPVSLKETIAYEIRKHTDATERDVYLFDDTTTVRTLPAAFWYLIGIESMSASRRVALTANALIDERTFVVVDESSFIKGHTAIRTRRITDMSVRARYRLLLTGTPISQGAVDLFAQMRFLSPQILGYKSFYSFARNHLEFSSEHPGVIVRTLRTDVLAAKINPYVYQVRKEECLNLPCKLYDERRFGMSREQKEAYDQAKWELLLGREDDEIITRHMLFRLFTALQQIISGFWHHTDTRLKINEHLEFNHVRLDVLESALDGMPDDAKVIIWCKYLYSVHAVSEMLLRLHGADAVAELHGQIPERRRGVEVERFRREARFLVATQSTGGHGLTLTEAHHVVFYENGFKYSDRIQAEDRCHRIGQDWPVTYVDLICHSSIDERIADTLQRKGNLVRDFKRRLDAIKDRAEADRIIKGL